MAKKNGPTNRLLPAHPKGRARVSNHTDLLDNIDGRSRMARRYRDIAAALVADAGGIERCSEARLQLIRRFAALSVQAEQLESRLANGEEIDLAAHAHISSTLVRLVSRLGIGRQAKAIPSLSDYLDGKVEAVE
jgi:hypothetical protein